ncbi:recombinase family protein, partial [Meiothermus sp.]|uniref:recombinase family protein n=1 Tax=Meiothermus sp. TaxID=1955249 RepID=UPI0026271449
YLGGIVPYGYTVEGGRLRSQPEEAAVVQQMFAWVAERGWSTERVAQELNRLGIPPKYRREGRGVRGNAPPGSGGGRGAAHPQEPHLYRGVHLRQAHPQTSARTGAGAGTAPRRTCALRGVPRSS